jgi:hypothetical protein
MKLLQKHSNVPLPVFLDSMVEYSGIERQKVPQRIAIKAIDLVSKASSAPIIFVGLNHSRQTHQSFSTQ